MTVNIRQKYDGLKAYLLLGVYNLTDEELLQAKKACADLLRAIPEATITFDLEDYRRTLYNQVRIMKRQLDEVSAPSFAAEVAAPQNSSLYQLALDHLGDALRWADLAALNGLREPFLTEDKLLQIPVR